jgi:ankyrin repeat domain-containing protein 50
MRRRDALRVFLGRSPKSPVLQQVVSAPNAQISSTADPVSGSSTHGPEETTESNTGNPALELATARHLNALPDQEKEVFRETSKNLTDENILIKVRECDVAHKDNSHFRPRAEALSRFLGLLDRFMAGVTIGLQANPDISAIVVGGVRTVIDLAVHFITFFTKLSDMLCSFSDHLKCLAEYAKASLQEELLLETLASVYGDLLQFCKHAYRVFTENGVPRRWISWRAFWRIQWISFEQEFGKIESDMQHHLDVLRHSAQALSLNATLHISPQERERRKKESGLSPLMCDGDVA